MSEPLICSSKFQVNGLPRIVRNPNTNSWDRLYTWILTTVYVPDLLKPDVVVMDCRLYQGSKEDAQTLCEYLNKVHKHKFKKESQDEQRRN